jgi:hypothetical protein
VLRRSKGLLVVPPVGWGLVRVSFDSFPAPAASIGVPKCPALRSPASFGDKVYGIFPVGKAFVMDCIAKTYSTFSNPFSFPHAV